MKTRWRIAIAAGAIAAIGAVVALKRSRPRFDMPKTLAALADREGVWDNQWNQHDEKIADLLGDAEMGGQCVNPGMRLEDAHVFNREDHVEGIRQARVCNSGREHPSRCRAKWSGR